MTSHALLLLLLLLAFHMDPELKRGICRKFQCIAWISFAYHILQYFDVYKNKTLRTEMRRIWQANTITSNHLSLDYPKCVCQHMKRDFDYIFSKGATKVVQLSMRGKFHWQKYVISKLEHNKLFCVRFYCWKGILLKINLLLTCLFGRLLVCSFIRT